MKSICIYAQPSTTTTKKTHVEFFLFTQTTSKYSHNMTVATGTQKMDKKWREKKENEISENNERNWRKAAETQVN